MQFAVPTTSPLGGAFSRKRDAAVQPVSGGMQPAAGLEKKYEKQVLKDRGFFRGQRHRSSEAPCFALGFRALCGLVLDRAPTSRRRRGRGMCAQSYSGVGLGTEALPPPRNMNATKPITSSNPIQQQTPIRFPSKTNRESTLKRNANNPRKILMPSEIPCTSLPSRLWIVFFPTELQRTAPKRRRSLKRWHLGDMYAESGQTLQGSFSAVSKPNFASKYS